MRTAKPKVLETQYLRGRVVPSGGLNSYSYFVTVHPVFLEHLERALGALGVRSVPRVASKQDTTNSETHNLFAVGIPSLA